MTFNPVLVEPQRKLNPSGNGSCRTSTRQPPSRGMENPPVPPLTAPQSVLDAPGRSAWIA